MSERTWLVRLAAVALIWVGGVEWLFGRVISRMAASPALEGVGRTVIEIIGRTGLFLLSTAFLLALTVYFAEVLYIGARANRGGERGRLVLAIYLALFGVLVAGHAALGAFTSLRDQAWLDITFNLLALIAFAVAGLQGAREPGVSVAARAGIAAVAVAYGTWYYSVLGSQIARAGGMTVPGTGGALLVGEAAALLVPVLLFAATSVPRGRWRGPRTWIVPAIGALLFSAGNIADMAADQGFTGVFTIWSVGFTLYLPWPLYAISLALYLHALGACFARRRKSPLGEYATPDTGMGLLLLLYAGLYLQLTYQHLLALLAVLLLGRLAQPLSRSLLTDTVPQGAHAAAPADQVETIAPTT